MELVRYRNSDHGGFDAVMTDGDAATEVQHPGNRNANLNGWPEGPIVEDRLVFSKDPVDTSLARLLCSLSPAIMGSFIAAFLLTDRNLPGRDLLTLVISIFVFFGLAWFGLAPWPTLRRLAFVLPVFLGSFWCLFR